MISKCRLQFWVSRAPICTLMPASGKAVGVRIGGAVAESAAPAEVTALILLFTRLL